MQTTCCCLQDQRQSDLQEAQSEDGHNAQKGLRSGMNFLLHTLRLSVVMLLCAFGSNLAFAVPMATSDITYSQTETEYSAQAVDVGFAARAPPMAVVNVTITGGITAMQGSAFATHGQETVAVLFGFGGDRNATNSGSGFGSWPRSNVQVDESLVIRQVDNTSCGQACGAMGLRDRGIDVQPTDIGSGLSLFQIGSPNNLATQISNAAPNVNWASGHADDLRGAFTVLTRPSGGSWVAGLRGSGSVNHAVVVDGVNAGGVVRIRDPWDQTTYTMSREDFFENWTGGFVGQ